MVTASLLLCGCSGLGYIPASVNSNGYQSTSSSSSSHGHDVATSSSSSSSSWTVSSSSAAVVALNAPSLSETDAPYLGDYQFTLTNPNSVDCVLHYPSSFSGSQVVMGERGLSANSSFRFSLSSSSQSSLHSYAYFTYGDVTSPRCSIDLSMSKPGNLLSATPLKTPSFGVDGSFRITASFSFCYASYVASCIKNNQVTIVGNYGDSATSTLQSFSFDASEGACSETYSGVSYSLDIAPGAPLYSSTYLRLNWVDKVLGLESGFNTLYTAELGTTPSLSDSDISLSSPVLAPVKQARVINDHKALGACYESTVTINAKDNVSLYAYVGTDTLGTKSLVGVNNGWTYDTTKKVYQKKIQNETAAKQTFYVIAEMRVGNYAINPAVEASVTLPKGIYAPRPESYSSEDKFVMITRKPEASVMWVNDNEERYQFSMSIQLLLIADGKDSISAGSFDNTQSVAGGQKATFGTGVQRKTIDTLAIQDKAFFTCSLWVSSNFFIISSFEVDDAPGSGIKNVFYSINYSGAWVAQK